MIPPSCSASPSSPEITHDCPTDPALSLFLDLQIFYFDTDAGGIVHNIAYLRLIEIARTQLAAQMGMDFETILRTQIHPVIVKTEIDYRRPARLGDWVRIHAYLSRWTRSRFWCRFEMVQKVSEPPHPSSPFLRQPATDSVNHPISHLEAQPPPLSTASTPSPPKTLLVQCEQTLALVQMPEGRPLRLPENFPYQWIS